MVKIENKGFPQPVLSARAAYNLMEGEIKNPKHLQCLKMKTDAKKKKINSNTLKDNLKIKKKKNDKSRLGKQIEDPKKKKNAKLELNNEVPKKKKNIKFELNNEVPKKKKNVKLDLNNEVGPQDKVNGKSQRISNKPTSKKSKKILRIKKNPVQSEKLESIDNGAKIPDAQKSKKRKKLVKNLEINGVDSTIKMKLGKSEEFLSFISEIQSTSNTESKKIPEAKESSTPFVKGNSKKRKINGVDVGTEQTKQAKKTIENKKILKLEKVQTKISPKIKPSDFLTIFKNPNLFEECNSKVYGAKIFESMISPEPVEKFFNEHWEKEHLFIKGSTNKFRGIFSTEDIDAMLRNNNLIYTKNIDITSYKEGKRETHNPEGRALAPVVWDFFNSGCSIRLLNPQTFSNSVWKLLSTLQEYFNSFCGANVYLTPPGTQGFAPHWDDIEAFIIQLEGKKRWRVYKWRSQRDTLPRESSGNFGPDDLLGEKVFDDTLEPGNMLYFPRGYIHQAEALDDTHSLHITISTYQKNSWADLLEKLVPAALQIAVEKDVEFRKGLPLECFHFSGIAYADIKNALKVKMRIKAQELVTKMMKRVPLDAAIDQLAKGFIHDALPPFLTTNEKRRTIFESGETWSKEANNVVNQTELTPETTIRLIRRGCVRILVEEETIRLYYSVENSREYHEDDAKFIEIDTDVAEGVEKLIHSYPQYITIEELPLAELSVKMALANGLWEKGLLIVEYPLETDEAL